MIVLRLTGCVPFEYSAPPRKSRNCTRFGPAEVAELVDALASGASVLTDVEVQVLFWAPSLFIQLDPLVFAQVAELVDALASGASILTDVEVQVLSWAPLLSEQAASCKLKAFRVKRETATHRGFFVPERCPTSVSGPPQYLAGSRATSSNAQPEATTSPSNTSATSSGSRGKKLSPVRASTSSMLTR